MSSTRCISLPAGSPEPAVRIVCEVTMNRIRLGTILVSGLASVLLLTSAGRSAAYGKASASPSEATLPPGVKAVWDLEKAHRDKTPTRERVCLNGLWRWQPGG